ncbi:NACHT domain-containing protein [Flavobacterium psychrotrophum]|uniref:NACHT domain-containing protein n=1 Tax=Flavobacterium psychrotrophum TaxID=2294119 RepID=UPI000E31A832|nr:NACHT domain-containing protein [Flavobacterium psychrotrophum]
MININYLHTPVENYIEPPIETNLQELPLEKLSWEDFEKLCLSVVQLDFSIDDCEIYGIKGQAQGGIDIFARKASGNYSSYQCKRYQKFEVDDLEKAVGYFRTQKFFSQSNDFYLCTSCEWNKTQIQDKFEELKTELEKDGITLHKWDKMQLSRHLKNHPQIVFDFFGSAWVKKFNGEPALQEISKSKKFDAFKMRNYRKELYIFYSTIFNLQDPGIPIKELNHPYTIQDRFILPDIFSTVDNAQWENVAENSNDSDSNNSFELDQYNYDDERYDEVRILSRFKKSKIDESLDSSRIDIRIKIDDALIESNKNIIIGDPGAGKSTLLRYLVLDILSTNPKLANISQQYGKLLPIWLPFAFITKHLSQDDTLSISEILKLWFKGNGKEYLYDLAKDALDDERLFLVIDGIDEWNSISSAQLAIKRIEITRDLFDCKILYSSRPYGFKLLKDYFTNLKVLNLAGFSRAQQKEFIERWHNKWASLQNSITDENFSKRQSEGFIRELNQAGDLSKLAETPLLLSILIIQKMRDSVLPRNKLDALKEITQYLINKHPAKRVMDAGIVQNINEDIDFKEIFCELAKYIQVQSNDGVVPKIEAQKAIENYLTTYTDYDRAKAKLKSKELIDVGANNFGIIIEKSTDEIAFSHKQFQEFLAAQFLFESDEEYTNNFIREYGANTSFHQVVVNLFGLIPQKQVKKYGSFFESLKSSNHKIYEKNYLTLISYEIAINIENAPTEIIKNGFDSITKDFIYETDSSFKEALLRRILATLQNGRLAERTQDFLNQFFPYEVRYKDNRIVLLRNLETLLPEQIEFLKIGLINGTIQVKYDVSNALKKHIKSDGIFSFMYDLILNCRNSEILAFAINSIIASDLEKEKLDTALNYIIDSSPEVQLFLHKYKIFHKEHSEDDLESVLYAVNNVPYQLKDEAIDLLIDGYARSKILKNKLLKSVRSEERYGKGIIDREIAWKVLFHCFNNDKQIIAQVNKEFENEFPFINAERHDMFRHLPFYFKGKKDQMPAVSEWLSKKMNKYNHIDNEIAFVGMFINTEEMKKRILSDLPKSGISHWHLMALLEGWPGDHDIKLKLKEYFRTSSPNNTAAAAHFVPKVFDINEKKEAIEILEKIVFTGKAYFRERAIAPLIELDSKYFEENILSKLLQEIHLIPQDVFGSYNIAIEEIAKNYSSNPDVKSFIFKEIDKNKDIFIIASQYYKDLDKGFKQLKKSLPLPNELRLLIIYEVNDLPSFPSKIAYNFGSFSEEGDHEIKADMAISLFNHIKETDPDKIVSLSRPLVFGRGFDHEIQRNIAFMGFLISKKLDEYFLLENDDSTTKEKARPVDIFYGHRLHRSTSTLIIKSIIENFDYFISIVQKDFKIMFKHPGSRNMEETWGFFAQQSVKSSPSYHYIMEYISENADAIKDKNLINFLSRTAPESSILRSILIRLLEDSNHSNQILAGKLLGLNFKNDNYVYKIVSNINDYMHIHQGRIMALCNGWPNDLKLKKIFDKLVGKKIYTTYEVNFSLKFLFRDIDNLVDFLNDALLNPNEVYGYHRYFIIPLIDRLRKDGTFKAKIKELLLGSKSVNEKVSYYNMLSHVNMIDEELRSWKSEVSDFYDDYGYDIISNKRVCLKDILYDYYY